jgi:Fic family protein
MLDGYRKGDILSWLEFFLKGIVRVAEEAIGVSNKIIDLREQSLQKISELGRAGKNANVLLKNLYKLPIINVRKIQEVTGLSREAANRLVDRFVKLGILSPKDKQKKYGRLFVYREYLGLFDEKE